MKIYIIQKFNPYFTSSASANRLLSLIEGLLNLNENIEIQLLITNGYQSQQEKKELGVSGTYKKVGYKYLNTSLIDNIWKRRWDIYVGSKINKFKVGLRLNRILKNSSAIFWIQYELIFFKWFYKQQKKGAKFKTFMELSEFLDIHKRNKGNFLQKRRADETQFFFENYFLERLSGLALMTNTLMKHYQTFSKSPELLHLPMTVDLNRFDQKILPLESFKKPYIAFVGVMNDAKDGVNILIEAFAGLVDKYKDLNLYLVGPWTYDTPNHLTRIKELKLEERIFWTGEHPRDEIPAIIQNALILTLPRPDSKQARGGFSTKLGEYLATGNPVCATKVGELPMYLKDEESVFFAEPGSVESFREAMDRALQDLGRAHKIGQQGKNVAIKNFNKDIQAQLLYEFLKKIEHGNKK